MMQKQTYYATIAVMLMVGFLAGYLIRDLPPGMRPKFPYSCTYAGKTYKHGQGFQASDGCNSCSCQNGQVACTLMACGITPDVDPDSGGGDEPSGTGTGTAIGYPVLPGQSEFAKIPDLSLVSVPNPKAPVTVNYVIEHRSALNGKAVSVTGIVVASWLAQQRCTGLRCPQTEMYVQPSILLADTSAPSRNPLYDLRIFVPDDAQLPADQYQVGTTVTVLGQVDGNREGVTMSFGLSADDPVRY